MTAAHTLPLVSTIAVGLSLAFVLGVIATKLRVPPIVGYLLAGILIGPYTPGFVGNLEVAEELSEIGIVLLMFGVGLHFSLRDLMDVRKIALPGAVVQMVAATVMGAALAHWAWGWSLQSGLMFGLALSVASTVVLLRSLEEHNLMQSTHGRIAIGWLIVEDLAMILALVLIPAFGKMHESGSTDMREILVPLFTAVAELILFMLVMYFGGRRILPWVMSMVAEMRSRELFTLAVFAAAVGVAYAASAIFGVSLALGAFFAGMIIRESDLNHEVADRALPFQDAFAVLFFVSVGMLFEPAVLLERPLDVIAVTAIIMIGKSLAAFFIVSIFRYGMKTALLVSASLAQIGEFSFVLVTLGTSYGLMPEESRNLVLAGALISIALNPLFFHATHTLHRRLRTDTRLKAALHTDDLNLAVLSQKEKSTLKNFVVQVGYGKSGKHISQKIRDAQIDLVIIDANRERVNELREQGYHAIAGDATYPETLLEAAIENARALVVATPDPFEARRIIDGARKLNPAIKVLAHAHNETEFNYYGDMKADAVLLGAHEVAVSAVAYLQKMKSNKGG